LKGKGLGTFVVPKDEDELEASKPIHGDGGDTVDIGKLLETP
jgi:hypothetical protein